MKRENGFTLIEITICLIIASLLFAGGVHLLSFYYNEVTRAKQKEKIETVTQALGNYLAVNGSLPCPASITKPVSDGQYGWSSNCKSVTIDSTDTVPGDCVSGLCIQESTRDIGGVRPRVRRGMLPFKTLNLSEDAAYDAYGSRFVYALTEDLADPTKYDEDMGGIDIRDQSSGTAVSAVAPAGGGLFVIFSPGENRVGGIDRQVKTRNACPTTANTPDDKNCKTITTSNKAATYWAGPQVRSNTANFIDDAVVFRTDQGPQLWRRSVGDQNNIVQRSSAPLVVGGLVGTPGASLSVPSGTDTDAGKMRVLGDLRVGVICNTANTFCFTPSRIGGQVTLNSSGTWSSTTNGMYCPNNNDAMTGLEIKSDGTTPSGNNIGAKCGAYNYTCPVVGGVQYILKGFDTTGAPICASRTADCLDSTIYLCNDHATNPTSNAAGADYPWDGTSGRETQYRSGIAAAGGNGAVREISVPTLDLVTKKVDLSKNLGYYKRKVQCSGGTWAWSANLPTGECSRSSCGVVSPELRDCSTLNLTGTTTTANISYGLDTITVGGTTYGSTTPITKIVNSPKMPSYNSSTGAFSLTATPIPTTGMWTGQYAYSKTCPSSGSPVESKTEETCKCKDSEYSFSYACPPGYSAGQSTAQTVLKYTFTCTYPDGINNPDQKRSYGTWTGPVPDFNAARNTLCTCNAGAAPVDKPVFGVVCNNKPGTISSRPGNPTLPPQQRWGMVCGGTNEGFTDLQQDPVPDTKCVCTPKAEPPITGPCNQDIPNPDGGAKLWNKKTGYTGNVVITKNIVCDVPAAGTTSAGKPIADYFVGGVYGRYEYGTPDESQCSDSGFKWKKTNGSDSQCNPPQPFKPLNSPCDAATDKTGKCRSGETCGSNGEWIVDCACTQ